MRFGVPKETPQADHRVGLTPWGVARLVELGHDVFVEHNAGTACHFSDAHYGEAGAKVVYSADEVYGRSDVICRVSWLRAKQIEMLRPGMTVCGFLHFAMAYKESVAKYEELGVNLIGYELIEASGGMRPLLTAMSLIAGQMTVHTAARLLEFESGGRGVLIGGIPGIPPATVVILGAGTVGTTAACQFLANGAHVIVLDSSLERLHSLHTRTEGRAVTAIASARQLWKYTAIADVLVGAILIPGGRVPFLVTEEMVKNMKDGSVILDVSVDQGGCVQTSRPTTLSSPTFKAHGVIHYCVPNMTASTPRVTSRAITMVAMPYLERMAREGVPEALRSDSGLARGVYMYRGKVVNAAAAGAHGVQAHDLAELLKEDEPA